MAADRFARKDFEGAMRKTGRRAARGRPLVSSRGEGCPRAEAKVRERVAGHTAAQGKETMAGQVAGRVRTTGVRTTGVRTTGVRTTGMRTTGLRTTGMRRGEV